MGRVGEEWGGGDKTYVSVINSGKAPYSQLALVTIERR